MIYNEGSNFSLGANLGLASVRREYRSPGRRSTSRSPPVNRAYKALKYAPFPVVAAPAGMALGGGCEIVLHADAVQAHAETYIGLVECGVGLIPGWGGCGEMLARWQAGSRSLPRGPMPAPRRCSRASARRTSQSRRIRRWKTKFLRPSRRHQHEPRPTSGRREATGFVAGRWLYAAEAAGIRPAGPVRSCGAECGGGGLPSAGIATDHDLVVADALAEVLCGGDTDIIDTVTEQQILDLERNAFMRLARTGPTRARISIRWKPANRYGIRPRGARSASLMRRPFTRRHGGRRPAIHDFPRCVLHGRGWCACAHHDAGGPVGRTGSRTRYSAPSSPCPLGRERL